MSLKPKFKIAEKYLESKELPLQHLDELIALREQSIEVKAKKLLKQ
ncbi:hypothetical protein J4219_04375 [Candidatus Woesearchaeota archaeon]|nr:hypothetical protein [Candidatus Woesearchaeota archaeon]